MSNERPLVVVNAHSTPNTDHKVMAEREYVASAGHEEVHHSRVD